MSRLFVNQQNQYVSVSPAVSINNLQQRTIMSWVKLNSYGTFSDTGLFGRNGGQTFYNIVNFSVAGYGSYSAVAKTSDASYTQDDFLVDRPPLGSWTHLAITFNNSTDKKIYFYINGVPVSAYTVQYVAANPLLDDSASAMILGNYVTSDTNYTIDGLLFDFRIYDSILTPTQLSAIVAGGPTTDPVPASNVMQLTFATNQGSTEPDASGHGNVGAITGATFSATNPTFDPPSGGVAAWLMEIVEEP